MQDYKIAPAQAGPARWATWTDLLLRQDNSSTNQNHLLSRITSRLQSEQPTITKLRPWGRSTNQKCSWRDSPKPSRQAQMKRSINWKEINTSPFCLIKSPFCPGCHHVQESVCVMCSLQSVICAIFSLCCVQFDSVSCAIFNLCYVQSLLCFIVMCSILSLLCAVLVCVMYSP